VGPGDLVWTSPISFVASANCALYCGADVDFVDIDPATFNMSTEQLAMKLESAERSGRLPKVVIPVHLAGQSCDMEAIHALSRQYGFRIIEDASHAVGAHYKREAVGNCRFSDIAVFSFHPVKIITTGEGGIALTNDRELAQAMRRLRTHGITRDESEMDGESHGGWYYEQLELGFNYRLTDMQAALGSSQMTRIGEFVARRRAIALRYDDAFANQPVRVQAQHPDTNSSYHLYIIRLREDDAIRHRAVFDELRGRGVGANLHYIPIYLQPYYRRLGFAPGHCPEAERYYASAISIPLYPDMSAADERAVLDAVKDAARA
jgi:UDP-4-amino-4,6-dideoxy-N-acetyl-beta-L-altrosamine transaminase